MRTALVIAAGALILQILVAQAWAESSTVEEALARGIAFAAGGNFAEAAKWFRKASDRGNSSAQYYLGQLYRMGQGVPRGYAEAAKWYRRAAEQGHVLAQFTLGLMYGMGQGVPRDYSEAERWFRRAAEQGHDDAQSNLGVMYGTGTGVAQDYVLAHLWFNLSAKSGNVTGRNNRDLLTKHMTPQQIEKATRLASEWKPNKE